MAVDVHCDADARVAFRSNITFGRAPVASIGGAWVWRKAAVHCYLALVVVQSCYPGVGVAVGGDAVGNGDSCMQR